MTSRQSLHISSQALNKRAIALFNYSCLTFILLSMLVIFEFEPLYTADEDILYYITQYQNPALNSAFTGFTNIGSTPFSVPITTALCLLLTWRKKTTAPVLVMAGATAFSTISTSVWKGEVGRSRPPYSFAVPPVETSPSFPSGHTLNATVIAGVFAMLCFYYFQQHWARRCVATIAVLYPLLMGFSRVFLGHHWPSDVLGGWLYGVVTVALTTTIFRQIVIQHSELFRFPKVIFKQ